jgi:peptidoglycan/xylan/chitin deacetylase (PgdA/CDA1 family)
MPPGLWEGPSDRRWVALTFDDGPHPEITDRILQALRRAQAPATFFVVGERAVKQKDLVRRIHSEGHEIGNHTWSHRPLALGWCEPYRQLARTEELLSELVPGTLRVFRPPFGAIGPGGPQALRRHGLTPVYWSVVPADWDPLTAETVKQRVLAEVHPGAVVVLHGGRPWHAGTADAVESIVNDLRERDYEIVPLSRMLQESAHQVGTR